MTTRLLFLLAGAGALSGCADLALQPAQVPHSMVITPADTLITEGQPAKLVLTVRDADLNEVPGPPAWAPAKWEISDPGALSIAPDGTATGLGGGNLRLIARAAGLEAWTTMRVNPANVKLTGTVHMNQAVQNAEAGVPIIAGRPALLRIFATGDEVSFYQPSVRATLYLNGEVVHQALMRPGSPMLPARVRQGRLDLTFNTLVPGEVVQPGLGLVAEIDTDGVVPLDQGSETRLPREGVMDLKVMEVPTHIQTIVPTLVTPFNDERVHAWTDAIDRHMEFSRTVLPIGAVDMRVSESFTLNEDLSTGTGWSRYLRAMRVKRRMEGDVGYYYGAVVLPPGSRWGGLGYVGLPIGVGGTSDRILAHELGHNMNLLHTTCGGAGGPDPSYPYDDGKTGQWGFDVKRGRLIDPNAYRDLMGYCNPDWVSDYHFNKALAHRRDTEVFPGAREDAPQAEPPRPQRTLMLWGSAGGGELELEPAFLVDGPPALPESGGPYRIEGFGEDGGSRFAFSFAPDRVEFGGGHFLFAVPHDPERDGALARVVLTGPEGEFALGPSSTPPMAIIRDRDSGQVRAILRDWNGNSRLFNIAEGNTEIMVSSGLPGGAR